MFKMTECPDCKKGSGIGHSASLIRAYKPGGRSRGRRFDPEAGILRQRKDACDLCAAMYKGVDVINEAGYIPQFGGTYGNIESAPYFTYRIRGSTDFDAFKEPYVVDSGIWPEIRKLPHIPDDPFGKDCLMKLQTWAKHCDKNHRQCSSATTGRLPTRVIDVGLVDSAKPLRLYKTQIEAERYTTLSYRWGNYTAFNTTKENFSRRLRSIDFQDFPILFQQAIIATRSLGVRYLWIDALCIIQDDRLDWEREAANMASTYGNSYLTLSASCAKSPLEPLAAVRESPLAFRYKDQHGHVNRIFIRVGNSHPIINEDAKRLAQLIDKYPIALRAWCFQERCLSPRIVHYTEREMVWNCGSATQCECGDVDERTSGKGRGVYQQLLKYIQEKGMDHTKSMGSISGWAHLLESYTNNKLTFDRDLLPALSGLAHQFQAAGAGEYLGGLWREGIEKQMTWRRSFTQEHAPKSYTAPSFSPLSSTGRIDWFGLAFESKPVMKIIEAGCTPSGVDPTGPVSSGFLKILGCVLEIRVESVASADGRPKGGIEGASPSTKPYKISWDADTLEGWDYPQPGKAIFLLEVKEIVCLVLAPVATKERTFRRLGISNRVKGPDSTGFELSSRRLSEAVEQTIIIE